MLNEKQLEEITDSIDQLIMDLCVKYKEHPLNISAIAVARLYLAASAGKATTEFKGILQNIIDDTGIDFKPQDINVH